MYRMLSPISSLPSVLFRLDLWPSAISCSKYGPRTPPRRLFTLVYGTSQFACLSRCPRHRGDVMGTWDVSIRPSHHNITTHKSLGYLLFGVSQTGVTPNIRHSSQSGGQPLAPTEVWLTLITFGSWLLAPSRSCTAWGSKPPSRASAQQYGRVVQQVLLRKI